MPVDRFASAATWLQGQRHEHASRPVSFVRGGKMIEVHATKGRTPFDVVDGDGFAIRHESVDWIVRTQDLVLDSTPMTPQAGDQIVETADGRLFTYEVSHPAGEAPWRWADQYRRDIRIHTKLIATTEVV